MTIKIFTVPEMVAAEKAADSAGVTYAQMMEVAGRAVAEATQDRFPVAGRQVLILVGPGNNGGDGLVAGRYLAEAGARVSFYLYRSRDVAEDVNFAHIQEMGLLYTVAAEDDNYAVLRSQVRTAAIVIDALLGTGVDRPIRGQLADLMRAARDALAGRAGVEAPPPLPRLSSVGALHGAQIPQGRKGSGRLTIVAVDCPSGLNTDSGALDPLALEADLTVTFAGPKRGHFNFPGAAACGELVVADIGIASNLDEVKQVPVRVATARLARRLLPERPGDGHKGTFGKILIIAGSDHYWGAPLLCGRGAYRAGAGLVAIATPEAVRPVVAGGLPEATYPPVPEAANFGAEGAAFLRGQVDGYDALLFGPGLGKANAFADELLAASDALPPLVVDADGLNVLATMDAWPERLPPGTILTPHPGEMARLMVVKLGALRERERIGLACEQAGAWGHVVLLKGAYTVVAAPDGRATVLPFANPALSTAGSGDVLAGIIVSLLGQGLPAYEAATLGGFLHGAAGKLAAAEVGDAGLLAGEVADWVPAARRALKTAG